MSTAQSLTQWVQPFVGFILPAAAFYLNIPGKKNLSISDSLLRDHRAASKAFWRELMQRVLSIDPPPRAALPPGGLIVRSCTPMILSSLYEAAIDRLVIDVLEKTTYRGAGRG